MAGTTTTVLMRQNGDIIWFDAILTFTKTYSGSVTKHPIERGGIVADHVINDNKTFTISGVISNADFNRDRIDEEGRMSLGGYVELPTGRARILNDEPQFDPTVITYNENPLTKYLPEQAAAFLDQSAPSVVMSTTYRYFGAEVMEDYFIAMQRNKEEFTVLEIINNVVHRATRNCILTNVSFQINADSGDAIYPNLTCESVEWVDSMLVKIPKRVTSGVKTKAASKENKGAQTGTKTVGPATTAPANVSKWEEWKRRKAQSAGGV